MAYPGSATYRATNPPEAPVKATYFSGIAPTFIAGPDSGSPLPSAALAAEPEEEEQTSVPPVTPEIEEAPEDAPENAPVPSIENPPLPEEGEPD